MVKSSFACIEKRANGEGSKGEQLQQCQNETDYNAAKINDKNKQQQQETLKNSSVPFENQPELTDTLPEPSNFEVTHIEDQNGEALNRYCTCKFLDSLSNFR